jgi:hypothetical protein
MTYQALVPSVVLLKSAPVLDVVGLKPRRARTVRTKTFAVTLLLGLGFLSSYLGGRCNQHVWMEAFMVF